MDNSENRYGIPYNQMLHDLTILKMERMSDLRVDCNDKFIACYFNTMSDLNDALNHYKATHYF